MDTLEKKTKVKELWQLCFHDDERFVNLLFDNLYRDENTICFEKGGKVTTALQMLPYCISFGETSLDVSYISGAATRPEYRNRGLMGRLLKESFEIMRSRNIPLSALIPAESWLYDYYASKGYASVFFRQELNFSSAHRFYGDGYHRVAMSMDELYRFFDEQMRRRSCCIQHGREDFNVICDDIYLDGGDVVALADSQNRLSALAFVVPGDDAVFVKELLAINTEAKEAMLHEVQSAFPGYSLRVFTEPTSENGSAVLMGMILTLPISSAAIGVSMGITGVAAGAATVGCCCQMVGFAVASYRENKMGGLIAQGIGTSMLQVPNIVKKPLIWIPPIVSSAILGPVSSAILRMTSTPTGSGMGSAGFVGQIMAWQSMTQTMSVPVAAIEIILMHFVLPALITLAVSEWMRKMKWIKDGDMLLRL